MVGDGRLELPTSGPPARRTTNCANPRLPKIVNYFIVLHNIELPNHLTCTSDVHVEVK